MLSGACLPNGKIGREDLDVFRAGAFASAKLRAADHTPADVALCRAVSPGCQVIVNLRDSRLGTGRYPSSEDYAKSCAADIERFYSAGVRVFVVDNEPNWQWVTQGYGPWQYAWFLRRVMPLLRALVPSDVQLVSPPLSWAPALWSRGGANTTPWTLDDWRAAYAFTDGGTARPLAHLFDFAGATCYWQSERQMLDPSFGCCFEAAHAMSGGLPVIITEFGTSMCDLSPRPSQGEIREAMAGQYPAYLRMLTMGGYVQSAHVFLIGGSQDWAGFRIDEQIAGAMVEPHPGRPRRRSLTGPWAV